MQFVNVVLHKMLNLGILKIIIVVNFNFLDKKYKIIKYFRRTQINIMLFEK